MNALYDSRVAGGGISDDSYQRGAINVLQRLRDGLDGAAPARKPGLFRRRAAGPRGVYLYGPVGRGKSMLMDLFYESLPADMPKRRVHFHDFMIGVHDALHESRQTGHGRVDNGARHSVLVDFAAALARQCRVLCFDEFHVSDIADAMILGRLFQSLFDQGIAIVTTSNREPGDLYAGGLQRDRFLPFIALIRDRMDVVALAGPVDYRTRYLRESGVYHCPLAGAGEWADRVFAHLTDGADVHPEDIMVRGRILPVVAAARGVARFSFAALCEQPVGAEDYLAIARTYHTVMLEGVARLGYDRRNEAKRLMTLVDVFYDQKTRLIITADAPPDRLYHGHDHAFEFDRTVSRLLEMQSPEWFAATSEKALKS